MTDNDLERRLRAETGPIEQGYVPSQLPTTLDAESERRPSRAARLAVLVPAVVAGVVVVAVATLVLSSNLDDGGIAAGGSPTPTASPFGPTYSASPSSPDPTSCQVSKVELTAEEWGGAAGSRGTVVTVRPNPGAAGCQLPLKMNVTIRDAAGSVVASGSAPELGADSVPLLRGLAITVLWSNWCGPSIADPVTMEIQFDGWSAPAAVDVAAGGDSPVPPCMGEGETHLSVMPAVVID